MKKILTTYLFVFILAILSGFSPVIHNHDLDLHDDHADCFTCGWTQTNLGTSPPLPENLNSFFEKFYQQASNTLNIKFPFGNFLSRASPALS